MDPCAAIQPLIPLFFLRSETDRSRSLFLCSPSPRFLNKGTNEPLLSYGEVPALGSFDPLRGLLRRAIRFRGLLPLPSRLIARSSLLGGGGGAGTG